ncbi:hypothetical protein [Aestuariivirga sp.]|uniref:hypothetical protein n=1 Tax=Aestuariivirga sp. TaxID=2650926 RepID=UPI0025BB1A91|nr:hypothetical protein [Aestuariivirga sp.]MCA3556310.1 hypothetical protein [Aestuariivirga sp.]
MNTGLNLFAEALVFVHGLGAESEAAKHAQICERLGDMETAETWRQLQGAVRSLKRPSDCAKLQAA